MDLDRLKGSFNWHLNLSKKIKKFEQLSEISNLKDKHLLELIRECRLELSDMDMTLSEFQEIYEALTEDGSTPAPVPDPEPELLQEDLEKEINDRMIGNLLSNIDKIKK